MYSVEKPPDWLKNLPKGAIKLGVNAFNAVLDKDGDEEAARKAAWAAVKTKYEKGERGQWRAKQDVSLRDVERMLREALEGREKDAWLRDVYGSVHPHVCGEHLFEKYGRVKQVGSSPRVWGTQKRMAETAIDERFIPTCVGNTRIRLSE